MVERPTEESLPAVTRAAAGERLDSWLAAVGAVASRAAAQRRIAAGAVTVNGRKVVKSARLECGDVVAVREAPRPTGSADPVALTAEIVFEDDDLLVVDKPAGLVVHPAPGHHGDTLVDQLAGRAVGGTEPWRPGIVHRLDRFTSGLLVVAKSEAAHAALQEQLRARTMRREYLALVWGRPRSATGTIDAPIGRDRRRRTRMSLETDVPRAAVTRFATERIFATTTLLRIQLETGRTHQIRAHLSAIGLPVCGDPEYGGGRPRRDDVDLKLDRQFLHAARLSFVHPITLEPVDRRSRLPGDLARALQLAEQVGAG